MAGGGESLHVDSGPVHVQVSGRTAITIIVFFAVIGALWFLVVREISAHDASMTDKVKAMQQSHQDLQDGIDAMVYISSLADIEKQKLNLREPDKIKRMRQ